MTANVPMLELVAAWEPIFFHQVGAKLGKRFCNELNS